MLSNAVVSASRHLMVSNHKVVLVPQSRTLLEIGSNKIVLDKAHVDHFATLFVATLVR